MTVPPETSDRTWAAALTLLFGTYLFGLFHIAMLPPFEGFDETAHYSYIRQIALTGTWPRHGDPMSAVVDDYLKVAPTALSMRPAWTYSGFSSAPAAVVAAGRQAIHAAPSGPPLWQGGTTANWEAQHPPLYYLVLAPAYRLTASWSLGAQLFSLRALSYTMAVGGLCLACQAVRRRPGPETRLPWPFRLAPALWPLLFPMWFPTMARLGNDSLVILITGVVALLLIRLFQKGGGRGLHLAVGLGLGLGLLTKATVLPLALAVLVLLALRAWTRPSRPIGQGCIDVAFCGAAILAVAGWWYVGQALQTGSLIGSNDAITLSQGVGLWEGMKQHGSLLTILRNLGTSFGLSLIWTGTWSFVAPPVPFMIPLLIATLLLAVAGALQARGAMLTLSDGLAPLTLILITAGLIYQSMLLFATIGSVAPAWYVHSFIPVLSPLLGWGIAGALRWRGLRWALIAQLIYAPIFILIATSVDLLLYSGCATTPARSHYLDLASAASCFADPSIMIDHLGVIAFPRLGLWFFVAGYGLLVSGVVATLRILVAAGEAQADQVVSPRL